MSTENDTGARRDWMGLLAKTPPAALAARMPEVPEHEWLRAPEVGAAMVRGRQGGTGAPFNLGEMTVTRCTLRLKSGEIGHAVVQGRDKAHATRAALIDAMMQTDRASAVRAEVLAPLAAERDAARDLRRAKAAATKVDFFTLVRGAN